MNYQSLTQNVISNVVLNPQQSYPSHTASIPLMSRTQQEIECSQTLSTEVKHSHPFEVQTYSIDTPDNKLSKRFGKRCRRLRKAGISLTHASMSNRTICSEINESFNDNSNDPPRSAQIFRIMSVNVNGLRGKLDSLTR